ncbi:hypothetical protein CSOJ01_09204 [Colletotrichum sojae]|uniref:Uncharacterized protein n=1 Tax=Colletotrichum sojae TaxID=2175907 RepID=A0A8H6MRQ2_9PEZI|nr:hypothetical protein CSOJ01_09204 [Colletotrichum sojae]
MFRGGVWGAPGVSGLESLSGFTDLSATRCRRGWIGSLDGGTGYETRERHEIGDKARAKAKANGKKKKGGVEEEGKGRGGRLASSMLWPPPRGTEPAGLTRPCQTGLKLRAAATCNAPFLTVSSCVEDSDSAGTQAPKHRLPPACPPGSGVCRKSEWHLQGQGLALASSCALQRCGSGQPGGGQGGKVQSAPRCSCDVTGPRVSRTSVVTSRRMTAGRDGHWTKHAEGGGEDSQRRDPGKHKAGTRARVPAGFESGQERPALTRDVMSVVRHLRHRSNFGKSDSLLPPPPSLVLLRRQSLGRQDVLIGCCCRLPRQHNYGAGPAAAANGKTWDGGGQRARVSQFGTFGRAREPSDGSNLELRSGSVMLTGGVEASGMVTCHHLTVVFTTVTT